MKFSTENISDLHAALTITVEPSDYEAKFMQELKKIRKTANIRGFRQGKAPIGFLRKVYGTQTLNDLLQKIVQESLPEYLREEDIQYILQPIMTEAKDALEATKAKDYNFVFEMGLMPNIELDTSAIALTDYQVFLSDENFEQKLNEILERNGELKAIEADVSLEEKDILSVKLEECDADNNVKEDGVVNETTMPVDIFKAGSERDIITTLVTGDDVVIDIFDYIDKEKEQIASVILGIKADSDINIDEISPKFKLTILEAKRLEKAALNEELHTKLFGDNSNKITFGEEEDKVLTQEDFRNKLRKEMTKAFDEMRTNYLDAMIVDTVNEKIKVGLPDEFILRYLRTTREDFNEAETHKIEGFKQSMSWQLIKGHIFRTNDMQIDEDEIEDMAYMGFRDQLLRMYGSVPLDFDFQSLVDKQMQDPKFRQQVTEELINMKIMDWLKGNLAISKENIEVDDFMEVVKKRNEEVEAKNAAMEAAANAAVEA
ncbi:MAG: trigger factor [Chitinophagales bacterium]